MSDNKLTISQVLSTNVINHRGRCIKLEESMGLHYNNSHVWFELTTKEKVELIQDRLIQFIYGPGRKLTGLTFLYPRSEKVYLILDDLRGDIKYISEDDRYLYTHSYFPEPICKYELKEDGYHLVDTLNININNHYAVAFNGNYVFILKDEVDTHFFILIYLPTFSIQIMPYADISITDMIYNLYLYPLKLKQELNMPYCVITDKYILDFSKYSQENVIDYHVNDKIYSVKIVNRPVIDLAKLCVRHDTLLNMNHEDGCKPDTLKILYLNLQTFPFVEHDFHILARGIRIPVNLDKLRSVPMYERKVSYQGYDNELVLDFHPEVVAFFVDLLHYGRSDVSISMVPELMELCDYVGRSDLIDVIYDDIYLACLCDVNKFTELMLAEIDDDIIRQFIFDVCLVHYQNVEVPYVIFRQALDQLCKYDCHYKLRTSVVQHDFTMNNELPWFVK